MTDHKFTDEEIIKALEWCRTAKMVTMKFFKCDRPLEITTTEKEICFGDVLDLINRQKAEIEELNTNLALAFDNAKNNTIERIREHTIRFVTINEFAERLKERAYTSSDWSHGEHPQVIECDDIDDLVQEMTGD